jgi:hypothetical protein
MKREYLYKILRGNIHGGGRVLEFLDIFFLIIG